MSEAKPLPGDINIDKSILSCMMNEPAKAVPVAVGIVKASDFSSETCGILFDILVRRFDLGEELDPISILSYLIDKNQAEAVGGAGFISEVYTTCLDASKIKSYCNTCLDYSKRRQVILEAGKLSRVAYGEVGESDDWRENAGAVIQKIDAAMTGGKASEIVHVKSVVLDYSEKMEAGMKENLDPAVPCGIGKLDSALDGGLRREYYLIGGRQGHGKTLLAMQFAGALANDGRRGLIVGYEMTALQMLMRDVAREGGIAVSQVMGRVGIEGSAVFQKLTRTLGKIGTNWDVHYIENPHITLESVASHAKSLHRIKPLDFLVIDYLQLIPRNRSSKKRDDEILVDLSNQCERLRKEIGCTLIAPVQLNDDGLIRDARGILDAPQVFLRIEMEETENEHGDMEAGDNGFLRILKARFGASNRKIPVFRNGQYQRFEDREHVEKKTFDNRRSGYGRR